jgi:hypothetical protein
MLNFEPFIGKSEPPVDMPFEQSQQFCVIEFTGKSSDYRVADTWYPSWASDGNLYSPYTDGVTDGVRSYSACGTTEHIGLFSRQEVQFNRNSDKPLQYALFFKCVMTACNHPMNILGRHRRRFADVEHERDIQ